MEVGEEYKGFVKWYLMCALTDRIYIRSMEAQKGNSLEVANEGLLEVDQTFSVYDDDFSHSFEQVL